MVAVNNSARLLTKTKPTGRHPPKALSASFLRSAPPGRHADGNGLYLFVQPTGTRSWIRRLVIRGRRREIGLGSLALVPLAEAREKALANRKLARQGGDPLAEKRRTEGIPTFAEAATRALEQKQAGWRNRKHAREWLSSLRRLAFPRIGKMPVSEVSSADVLEVLTPLWHRKAETARRVRLRLRAVLEWAVAMEYRIDNPCDRIGPVLGTQQTRCPAHAGLAASRGGCGYPDGAGIDGIGGSEAGLRVPGADGSQVERGAVGRVGRDRSQREGVDHPGQADEGEPPASGAAVWTCPGDSRGGAGTREREPVRWCSPLGAESLSMTSSCGGCCASRGLRRCRTVSAPVFRDWAGEETAHPREVVETALAHVVRNRVEAAYGPLGPVRAAACPDGRLGALPGPGDGGGPGALRVKRPKGIGCRGKAG